jgi:hypothetical protein
MSLSAWSRFKSVRDGRHSVYSRPAAVADARATPGKSPRRRKGELRPILREARTRAKCIHRRIAAEALAVACPLRAIDNRSNYAVAVPRLSAERARGEHCQSTRKIFSDCGAVSSRRSRKRKRSERCWVSANPRVPTQTSRRASLFSRKSHISDSSVNCLVNHDVTKALPL